MEQAEGGPGPGDVVRRYRLDEALADGSFLGTDTTLDRRVVVTTLTAAAAADPARRAAFSRDAAALAGLVSPYVVAVHDHGVDPVPYVVTQHLAGGTLADLLRREGPLPAPAAVSLVAQVAGGLADLHRAGLVHGALDPTAVLLRDAAPEPGEVPRVCLAGPAGPDARPGGDYVAPERAGGAEASVAADVYAAGRVLRACLPDPATGGSSLGRGLDWVLARSTADGPAQRYRDAASLRADLLTLLPADLRGAVAPPAEPPVGPEVEPPPEPARAPAADDGGRGRRRGLLVLAAAVVAVLVVASGLAVAGLGDGGGDGVAGERVEAPGPGNDDGDGDGGNGDVPVTGDLDGDGLGDVVVVHRTDDDVPALTTYLSDGGAPGDRTDVAATDPLTPLVADLDRSAAEGASEVWDQALEGDALVLRSGDRTITVAGAGDPRAGGAAVAGDLDGDGTDDLALLVPSPDGGAEVRVATGGDTDTWTAEPRLADASWDAGSDLLVPGDLDGDGTDDLTLVRRDREAGSVRLVPLLDDGGPLRAGEPSAVVEEVALHVFRGADVDGDGADEVVMVPTEGGADVLELGRDGERWTTPAVVGALPGTPGDAVPTSGVSDVDGDGRDDLVLVRQPGRGGDLLLEVLPAEDGGAYGGPVVSLALASGAADATAKVLDGTVHNPFLRPPRLSGGQVERRGDQPTTSVCSRPGPTPTPQNGAPESSSRART